MTNDLTVYLGDKRKKGSGGFPEAVDQVCFIRAPESGFVDVVDGRDIAWPFGSNSLRVYVHLSPLAGPIHKVLPIYAFGNIWPTPH